MLLLVDVLTGRANLNSLTMRAVAVWHIFSHRLVLYAKSKTYLPHRLFQREYDDEALLEFAPPAVSIPGTNRIPFALVAGIGPRLLAHPAGRRPARFEGLRGASEPHPNRCGTDRCGSAGKAAFRTSAPP
jgi:hypothetical protein